MTTIKHTCPADVIQAQQIAMEEMQERIDRLRGELKQHRTNLANGYGAQDATDAEIAQAIIRAYPGRFGGIASELAAHLTAMRTRAKRSPTIKDVMLGKDFIVEE